MKLILKCNKRNKVTRFFHLSVCRLPLCHPEAYHGEFHLAVVTSIDEHVWHGATHPEGIEVSVSKGDDHDDVEEDDVKDYLYQNLPHPDFFQPFILRERKRKYQRKNQPDFWRLKLPSTNGLTINDQLVNNKWILFGKTKNAFINWYICMDLH